MKVKQFSLIEKEGTRHGGSLKNPQKRKRPLSTSQSIHLVLRSSKAKGEQSFLKHDREIKKILQKFAAKYSITIEGMANVGNHIHLHIKLFRRRLYSPFIRAVTAAIMMKVTGYNRWNPKPEGFQFWDQRPFSSVVTAFRYLKNLKDYILLNQFEARGFLRPEAKYYLARKKRPNPG